MRSDAVRGDRREHQRVAVGIGLGDGGRRDGAAGAAAIADHHRLADGVAELLAEQASDEIGGAAGRHRDHEGDGFVGVVALGERGRGEGDEREDEDPCKDHKSVPCVAAGAWLNLSSLRGVGWVEPSETHHSESEGAAMGFAALNPSYEEGVDDRDKPGYDV